MLESLEWGLMTSVVYSLMDTFAALVGVQPFGHLCLGHQTDIFSLGAYPSVVLHLLAPFASYNGR